LPVFLEGVLIKAHQVLFRGNDIKKDENH